DDGNGLCVVVDARRRRWNRLLNRLDPLIDGAANVINGHLSVDTRIPAILDLNLTTVVVSQNPPLAAVVCLEDRTRHHVGEENFVAFDWRQRVGQEQVARVGGKLGKSGSAEVVGVADHLLKLGVPVWQVFFSQNTSSLGDR